MGKARGKWVLVAGWEDVRAKQESTKRTCGRRLELLAFLCFFMLRPDSTLLAATSCSESCIVTTSTYIAYVLPNTTGSHPWWHYDLGAGCDPITEKYTVYTYTPGMIIYLIYRPIKSYWDASNRRWVHISTAPYGTYAPELPAGIYWGGSAEQVFPKGCSDLPSQQPDQAPNPDPGKPDCPQTPLN